MAGSEDAKVRALVSIAASLKELTRIMEAFNTNMVQFGQAYKNNHERVPPEKYKAEWYDPAQLTFGGPETKKEGE